MHGDFLSLSLFIIISSITPGPNNLMLLQGGLTSGYRACYQHMFGISLGVATMIFFSYWGMAELIIRQPLFMGGLKLVGTAYLLWLTWGMWVGGIVPSKRKIDNAKKQSHWQLPLNFGQAALFQWINPKAWLMASLMPSIALITGETPTTDNLPIYLLFICLNISCISIWAAGGNALRQLLHRERLMFIIHKSIVFATLYCAVAMWV